MSGAGAVGGVTPATAAGPHDGGAKAGAQQPDGKAADGKTVEAKAAEAKATDGKSSAPPLPETSGRAPPATAVALAATLAGLKPGQELRGTVRLLPGQPQALLTTPEGDFLIDPATGLEPDSPVSLVLVRADRAISALLLMNGRAALDPPRPVQLTLVSVHGAPAPVAEPQGAARAAPAAPPLPARGDGASSLTSLLPGEAIFLRGGSHPLGPNTNAAAGHPPAPAPTTQAGHGVAANAARGAMPLPRAADMPARPPATASASALAPTPALPLAPASPGPAAAIPAGAASAADPLTLLFERGAMPLTLQTGPANTPGQAKAPGQTLSASLLAARAPGERSPLSHPPASSPLARLAETGRLITATVLPPQDDGAPRAATAQARLLAGAPAGHPMETVAGTATRPAIGQSGSGQPPVGSATPASGTQTLPPAAPSPTPSAPASLPPAPAPGQPVQLTINGTGARIALPPDLPAPAAGTQLVFLVTKGHEALRALPAAPPVTQNQVPQTQAQAQVQISPPLTAQATGPSAGEGAGESAAAPRSHEAGQPAPTPQAPSPQASGPQAPAAQTAGPANAPAAAEAPQLLWVPGMPLPASALPASAPAAVSGAEALLMAVMQALGRKGFAAAPRDHASRSADAEVDGMDGAPGLLTAARLLAAAAASPAAPPARAGKAQDAPLPATAPEALPLVTTLQTPQGQVPLVFLVWQPVRGDEEGRNSGAPEEGEPDVCFAVDVEFESIGRLRLRGAVGRSHLDLGVETEKPLGTALQHAASRDFTEAVEAGGMTGTLVFRYRQGD